MALNWMEKGIRNVTTVYGGEAAMRDAGFRFLYPKNWKNKNNL